MKKLSFVVSLTNNENDYQQEQAAAAEKAARRLGVDVKIIQADNDSLKQSQQLLDIIQNTTGPRPDAIIFEPAGGTAFPQVARAAAAAGIGWVVLNHDVDYVPQLRKAYPGVPVFSISSDHVEVGRIQGKQFAALLPEGGSVLYIEGPAASSAAKDRTRGMNETKPANIQAKVMRANWTEESSYRAVSSWLRLRTSHEMHIELVGAQDDSMAMGARKSVRRAGAGRSRALAENAFHRLRWHAQDRPGLGAKRGAGSDNLYPPEYGSCPGDADRSDPQGIASAGAAFDDSGISTGPRGNYTPCSEAERRQTAFRHRLNRKRL